MRFECLFLWLLCQVFWNHVTCDDEALRECANIHHISIQVIPSVHATFTNHKCLLNCLVDNKTLASDPINEGVACPGDSTGICRNGQCIGGKEEAIAECGKLHSLDFHLVMNSGTLYTNSLCALRCVIDGNLIGLHAVNEGLQCPKDFNGLCRNGQCLTASETKPTIGPTLEPTIRPTIGSTFGPTIRPTIGPTIGPTFKPTIGPTIGPTIRPTIKPTNPPTTSQSILPIQVTLTRATILEPTSISSHQVQFCFQYTGSKPFSWGECDLLYTSGEIHSNQTVQEKCFTILQHSADSVLAFRFWHDGTSNFGFNYEFERYILQKSSDKWTETFYNNAFFLALEFEKI